MSTIIVDPKSCNNCGICSKVCTMGIVEPGRDGSVPVVLEDKAGMCIFCGHCEAFCPENALVVNLRPEEHVSLPEGSGMLLPEDLSTYLRKRRSVRHFTDRPVSKEVIESILGVAAFAASGGNGQPVRWVVVHDSEEVKKIAGLAIEWMKSLDLSNHPMRDYLPVLISAWEHGTDVVCRGAPHLLVAVIPEENQIAPVDAIIALTHFDLAAPAWGVGTCWGGFVAMAATQYEPLKKFLGIEPGKKCAYAMMFGHPRYQVHAIPRRNQPKVRWM